MNVKNVAVFSGKWVLLTLFFTVCFIIGTLLSGLAAANPEQSSETAGQSMGWLLANSAVAVSLLAWLSIRSGWSRWKTMGSLFLLLFGIGTFLPQLDSLFFSNPLGMSSSQVWAIIWSGAIAALLYVPVSVWLFSSGRSVSQEKARSSTSNFPFLNIGLLSLIYVFMYFLFGYFIAWRSDALREFYSGTSDLLPFGSHLLSTWGSSPGLFALQLIRGLIWAMLAYLAGSMIRCRNNWEKVILIAALFSLTGTLLLLLPNPFMPEVVRKVHFIEVLSSNFLFGGIAGWLLFIKRQSSDSQPQINSILS